MTSLRIATLAVAGLLAACQSAPPQQTDLEAARQALNTASADSAAVAAAGVELERARAELRRADSAWLDRHDQSETAHDAYLVSQRVAIATAVAQQRALESRIALASTERDRMRLDARTREAQSAGERAEVARLQAQGSRADAQSARSMAEEARMRAQQSEQQRVAAEAETALARQQAQGSRDQAQSAQAMAQGARAEAALADRQRAAAESQTVLARQQTQDATDDARRLEAALEKLAAKQTERGLVLTLQDVLFDLDRADLKPGAMRTLEQLAAVLRQYPDRRIAVEGFTDSQGSDSYNLSLSDRRAAAVKEALVRQGVDPARIATHGFGTAFPVADNSSPAGRQVNRRVEIVFSDAQGKVGAR